MTQHDAPIISPKKLIEVALVLVNEDDRVEGPFYIRRPFDREPDWGVASINYKLNELLARAEVITFAAARN